MSSAMVAFTFGVSNITAQKALDILAASGALTKNGLLYSKP
jgi:DNA-binding GntR family transcriptional regulator